MNISFRMLSVDLLHALRNKALLQLAKINMRFKTKTNTTWSHIYVESNKTNKQTKQKTDP